MTEGMADITVNWVEPQDVYSVMDAVFNYVMVEWRIRPESYISLLLLRILHEVRYFSSVANNATEQDMIVCFVNLLMEKNSARGRNRKAPLDWTESHKLVTYVAAKFRKSMSNMYDVDPYTCRSSKTGEDAKDKRIAQLQQQVNQLKAQKGGSNNQQGILKRNFQQKTGGGQSQGAWTIQDKMDKTCRDWNSNSGCSRVTDNKHWCMDSQGRRRKHGCGRVDGSNICWKNHKTEEHH